MTEQPDAKHDVERAPSARKRAAQGAAEGARGGPEGALAGAAAGLLAGGKKHAARASGGGRKALVAEFGVCMALLLIAPLVGKSDDAGAWMRKATAIVALFIMLGFLSAFGGTARKVANGLGLLVALGTLLSQQSSFTALLSAINSDTAGGAGAADDPANVGTGLDGNALNPTTVARTGPIVPSLLGQLSTPVSWATQGLLDLFGLGDVGSTVVIPYAGHPIGSHSTDPSSPESSAAEIAQETELKLILGSLIP